MSGVFSKTAKGMAEIDQRTDDMPMRVRRVLIMVDGNHTVEELRAMTLVENVELALDFLEKNGFIERGVQAVEPDADQHDQTIEFSFREIPDHPDREDMEKAKHFIINTLKTFCGPMSHLSIVKAVSAAESHQELRENFLPWFNAIVETNAGRRRAEELSELLLKVI